MKTMITEDYVSFETAKLLIKKNFGYNAEYESYYTFHGKVVYFKDDPKVLNIAPRITLQMAMKWLREVHKIDITVDPHEVGNNWIYQFHICQNKVYLLSRDIDTSYENCAKAAIKYCLENLI